MRFVRFLPARAGHLLLFGVLLPQACVPSFDDDVSLIREPQVLAVQAEPAEAAPGEAVQLTALVATPDAHAAAPALSWGLCIARKPLTELGPVNPVCVQPAERAPESIVDLGAGASVSATIPRDPVDACRLFGPSPPEAMNGQPAGRPVDPDPTGGFYQPVGVTLAGSTTLGALRVACLPSGLDLELSGQFKQKYRRNQNPVLSQLSLNSTGEEQPITGDADSLSVAAGTVVRLRGAWDACPTSPECGDGICGPQEDSATCADDCTAPKGCTGAETYAWFNSDSRQVETKRESLRVSWYATRGRFEHSTTGRDESELDTHTENAWTAPSEPGDVRFWLVTRDARGGQSFRSFVVSVAPR